MIMIRVMYYRDLNSLASSLALASLSHLASWAAAAAPAHWHWQVLPHRRVSLTRPGSARHWHWHGPSQNSGPGCVTAGAVTVPAVCRAAPAGAPAGSERGSMGG
jgi:hypothetical protein